MRKVLVICNTVLQIIFAAQLKITEFSNDEVDLIISDHTSSAKTVVDNSKNSTLFNCIYYSETKEFVRSEAALVTHGGFGYYLDRIHKESIIEKLFVSESNYDVLLAANPDKFTNLLFEVLRKKNAGLEYYMFEDGLSAYCLLGEQLARQINAKASILHRLFDKITGKKSASQHINGVFLFHPDLCQWDLGIPFFQIESIKRDKSLIDELNILFNYSEDHEQYKERFIFFEESYSVEKTNVNDIELVDRIARIVGKDNIMIKIHPRNPVNRFKNRGYKTNKNTFIPWELILLNECFQDKILLSIASGSIANPFLYFGMDTKSIVLLKCVSGEFGESGNIYNEFLLHNVFLKDNAIFSVPNDFNDLEFLLKGLTAI